MNIKKIFFTSLLVGTLDGAAAIIKYMAKGGAHVEVIFKFIASGLFGKAAFSGGTGMVLAGIAFHYLIAGTWTFLFFFLYPRFKPEWKNKYLSGFMYGLMIWLIMNLVVVPLSNTPALEKVLSDHLIGIGIIILAVGLPISTIYHYKEK